MPDKKRTLIKLIVIFNFFIISNNVFCTSDRAYNIDHLSLSDGLSQSSVYSIIQDNQGFMWFATEDGLNKYDGYSFSVFKNISFNENSLSENSIYSIDEGKPGILWISTWSTGLNKYNIKTNQFTHYLNISGDSTSLSSNVLFAVLVDNDGYVWVGTDKGLNRLDTETGIFRQYHKERNDNTGLADEKVNKLLLDGNGNIWAGGLYDGLSMYNRQKDNFINYINDPKNNNSLINNEIYSLTADKTDPDVIWVGTGHGGIEKINSKTRKIGHFGHGFNSAIPNDYINAVETDYNGNIWVGTDKNGIFVLNPKGHLIKEFKHDPHDPNSISLNDIYSLYASRSGIIWAGTNGAAINIISPKTKNFGTFRFSQETNNNISDNMVSGIMEDKNNNIWISSWSSGITILNKKTNKARVIQKDTKNNKGLNSNSVYMLFQFKDGKIGITTNDGGLNIYNPVTNRFKYIENIPGNDNSLASDVVMCGYEDNDGIVWLGFYDKGIDRWDRREGVFTHFRYNKDDTTSLAGNRIYTMFEDINHNLWISSERAGLSRFNKKTEKFTRFTHNVNNPNSLSSNDVMVLYQAKDKTLWIGTYGGGLNKFNYSDNTFKSYKEEDGLPNNVVYGILEDKNGDLWLSTNKGLSRFNPVTEQFRNYDIMDGLQSNEFNSAYCKAADGEMYFGGINGLNSFFPCEIKDNKYIPPVYITNLQILNKKILVNEKYDNRIVLSSTITYTSRIELTYKDNVVNFEFAALNYISSHKNKYAYKLEGFDSEWTNSGSRRFASYSNLPPGKYQFKVRGSNNDGFWDESGTTLNIVVIPAYWQTVWFKILIGLVVISFFWVAHLYRLYGINKKNKQLYNMNTRLIQEVSERKKAEKDLIASKMRFIQLAQATFEAIFITDKNKIIEVNQSAVDMFGYQRNELLKMSISDLVTPGHKENVNESIFIQNSGPFKATGIRKDSSVFFIELHGKDIEYNDKKYRVIAINNITEKVETDKQKEILEEQLRQAQKMEAIGSLAGGVAHDFNNLLQVIRGFSEMAVKKLHKGNPATHDLLQVISTSEKASQLTRQLLAFSRKQTYQPVVLDLNILINDLEIILSRFLPPDINIKKNLEENLPMIFADPGQVEQILINLIVNARDAINEIKNGSVKRIEILTKKVVVDEKFLSRHIDVKTGDYVCMEIKDTGCGMSREIMQRIYEPFFTTKPEGKGTGLGLSTVYGIIKQNKASIDVESNVNVGTSFKIYWPSTEEIVEEKDIKETAIEETHGSGSILLVEDEEGIRNFAVISLQQHGYNVFTAENGKEALQMIEDQKIEFDLLISDLNMPDMNGEELISILYEKIPDLKVLIISGYSDDFISDNGFLDKNINFLQKPFSIKKLAGKVHSILAKN